MAGVPQNVMGSSQQQRSLVGVSANTCNGVEDWSQDFDLAFEAPPRLNSGRAFASLSNNSLFSPASAKWEWVESESPPSSGLHGSPRAKVLPVKGGGATEAAAVEKDEDWGHSVVVVHDTETGLELNVDEEEDWDEEFGLGPGRTAGGGSTGGSHAQADSDDLSEVVELLRQAGEVGTDAIDSSSSLGLSSLLDTDDWDRDLYAGVDANNSMMTRSIIAKGFKLLLKTGSADTGVAWATQSDGGFGGLDGLPDRCRITTSLLRGPQDGNLRIVRYPRACHLMTLDVGGGGGKAMHGQRLIDWLVQLVGRRKATQGHGRQSVHCASRSDAAQLARYLSGMEKSVGEESSRAFLDCARSFWALGEVEPTLQILRTYFKTLRRTVHAGGRNLQATATIRGPLGGIDLPQGQDIYVMFRHTVAMLELAARALRPDVGMRTMGGGADAWLPSTPAGQDDAGNRRGAYGEMLRSAIAAFPSFRATFALLELKAVAHHLPTMMSEVENTRESYDESDDDLYRSDASNSARSITKSRLIEDRQRQEFLWSAQGARSGGGSTPLHRLPQALCSNIARQLQKTIRNVSSKVETGNDPSFDTEFERTPLYICATALTDLCLTLAGVSPLTMEDEPPLLRLMLAEAEEWDGDDVDSMASGSEELESEIDDDGWDSSSDTDDVYGGAVSTVLREWGEELAVPLNAPNSAPNASLGGTHSQLEAAERDRADAASGGAANVHATTLQDIWRALVGHDDPARLDFRRPPVLMRNLRQPADAAVFLDALLPAYKLLPLESQLKARMAFLLGLLATAARSVDLAETLHLEAVLCLDRLPCASIATASAHEANHLPASSILLPTQPILTRFGVHALERLGDALIKNGKYEYGIFALERAIECFSEINGGLREHEKLIRRVTRLTLSHKDVSRSLRYHVHMLQRAKEDDNVNEFVYLAREIAGILVEQGNFPQAEMYLGCASFLLSGMKLDSVCLRLPDGSSSFAPGMGVLSPPNSPPPGSTSDAFPVPLVDCVATKTGAGAPAGDESGGFATNLMSNHSSPVSAGPAMDTQQFTLQMKIVEVLMSSLQHQRALKLLNILLTRRVASAQRSKVLLALAKCYLKLHRIAACEAALERILSEADNILTSFESSESSTAMHSHGRNATAGSGSSGFVNKVLGGRATDGSGTSSGGGFLSLAGAVAVIKSVDFLSLRAKCRLAAGDASTALHWVDIALAVCEGARQNHWLGKLCRIQGRCFQAFVDKAREDFNSLSKVEPMDHPDVIDAREKEIGYARLAEEAYNAAHSHYQAADDVRCQAKCHAQACEMHLSRMFADVALQRIPVVDAALGCGADILPAAETHAVMALELAGDTASPLVLIQSLINMAEVHWLQMRPAKAYNAWKEAQMVLTLTYMQRQDVASVAESRGQQASAPAATPLRTPALPTIPHLPSTLLRVFGLLTRIVRLSFVMAGPPPPRSAEEDPLTWPVNPVLASALPNSTHLIAGWYIMEGKVGAIERESLPLSSSSSLPRGHRRGVGTVVPRSSRSHSGSVRPPTSRSAFNSSRSMGQLARVYNSPLSEMDECVHGVNPSSGSMTASPSPSGGLWGTSEAPNMLHPSFGRPTLPRKGRKKRSKKICVPSQMSIGSLGSIREILMEAGSSDTAMHSLQGSAATPHASSGNIDPGVEAVTSSSPPLWHRMSLRSSKSKELSSPPPGSGPQNQRTDSPPSPPGLSMRGSGSPLKARHNSIVGRLSAALGGTLPVRLSDKSPSSPPEISAREGATPPTPPVGLALRRDSSSTMLDSGSPTRNRVRENSGSRTPPKSRSRRSVRVGLPEGDGSDAGSAHGSIGRSFVRFGNGKSGSSSMSCYSQQVSLSMTFAAMQRALEFTNASSAACEAAISAKDIIEQQEREELKASLSGGSFSALGHMRVMTHSPMGALLGLRMTEAGTLIDLSAATSSMNRQHRYTQSSGEGMGKGFSSRTRLVTDPPSAVTPNGAPVANTDVGHIGLPSAVSASDLPGTTLDSLRSVHYSRMDVEGTKSVTSTTESTATRLRRRMSLLPPKSTEGSPSILRFNSGLMKASVPAVSSSEDVSNRASTSVTGRVPRGGEVFLTERAEWKFPEMSAQNLGMNTDPRVRTLWVGFCLMKRNSLLYSHGQLSLSDLRISNIETMHTLVESGKALCRPILRADRKTATAGTGEQSLGASPIVSSSPLGPPTSLSGSAHIQSELGPRASPAQHFSPRARLLVDELLQSPNLGAPAGSPDSFGDLPPGSRKESIGEERGTPNGSLRKKRQGRKGLSSELHTDAAANMLRTGSIVGSNMSEGIAARSLKCRHAYPLNFSFLLHMDGVYMYYCPASGERRIVPVSSLRPPPLPLRVSLPVTPTRQHVLGRPPALVDELEPTGPREDMGTFDELLTSLSDACPNDVLRLIPHLDEDYTAQDLAVAALVDRLSAQLTLFLVTALLLEQPVLLVASPGSEELLMQASAGLLHLVRPLHWQHAHVAVLHEGSSHILRHAIRSKVPFLIGTYVSVAERVCPAVLKNAPSAPPAVRSSARRATTGALLEGALGVNFEEATDVTHITIVDLDRGIVHPSRVLEYAAATTMNASYAPDADPSFRASVPQTVASQYSERFETQVGVGMALSRRSSGLMVLQNVSSASSGPFASHFVPGMLPPIPARYRHQIGQRLDMAQEMDTPELSSLSSFAEQIGGGGRRRSSGTMHATPSAGGAKTAYHSSPTVSIGGTLPLQSGSMRCAESLRYSMFLVMVSLLKPYHLFLEVPTGKSPGSCCMEDFKVESYVEFVKDDIQPFVQCLASTRAFAAFVKSGGAYHRAALSASSAAATALAVSGPRPKTGGHRGGLLSPRRGGRRPSRESAPAAQVSPQPSGSLKAGSLARRAPERFRPQFEAAIQARMHQKLRLYQTVATERIGAYLFTHFINSEEVTVQPVPPLTRHGAMLALRSAHGLSRAPREKRRWCVLDATRLSYFRSRNRRRPKGHIPMDPRSVTLLCPPFSVHYSAVTNESDAVALICATMPPEVGTLVIRAEQISVHDQWVRALKARLTPMEHYQKMVALFNAGSLSVPKTPQHDD